MHLESMSARARDRYDRIGGARILVHEAKLEDGVGFWRPRRRTGVAALDVEVGSLFLQVRHVGGADPLHIAPTVSTVTAVARDRLCAGWYEANSRDLWRRLVRQRVTTVSGTGSIRPHQAWLQTGICRSFGRRQGVHGVIGSVCETRV